MKKLNKGDRITIEKTVDGVSVGSYNNPDNPTEPQVFIVGENKNGEIELIREPKANGRH